MDWPFIATERLLLRPWRSADFEPFAKLNGDPRVRQYFPSVLSLEESNREAECMSSFIKAHGWGFWAVSLPGVSDFIGFIGLEEVDFIAPFTPAVEVGWRLAFDYWGKGYATEGALAALKHAFETLRLDEVVSFTTVENFRSRPLWNGLG